MHVLPVRLGQSVCQSMSLCVCECTPYVSVCLSVSVRLSVCLSVCTSVCIVCECERCVSASDCACQSDRKASHSVSF